MPYNFFSTKKFSFTPQELALSNAMIAYYSSFVSTFNPNPANNPLQLPQWLPYTIANDISLNENLTLVVTSGFRGPQCDFWTKYSVHNGLWQLQNIC